MSSRKEDEYKEIFLSEAVESYEQLNKLFTDLEKDHKNNRAIDAIFRITHTLKGNAMGMGFKDIAELSHVMEDIFNEVKANRLSLDETLFNNLFKANDKLGQLIEALRTDAKVNYKGIKTTLEVVLRNCKNEQPTNESNVETVVENIGLTDKVVDNPESETLISLTTDAAVIDEKITEAITESEIENVTSKNDQILQLIEEIIEEEEDEEEEDNIAQQMALSDVVQVPVRKLDSLLNIVGELIIEKDSLIARNIALGGRANDLARLHRITSDLQYGVMDVRLAQIGFLFNKFHRIIRDVASIEKKKVQLELEGTEIEIDRNVLKTMSDSLVHLIRNSVSHGIELPDERLRRGKPECGTITLRARNEKDTVFIEVVDDGNGIDANKIKSIALQKGVVTQAFANSMSDDEAIMLIFEPGFSSAEKITSVSGRGVGMDVVKKATESIGGKIMVHTELGKGSTFTLSLPSSMAVKGALLFELEKQEYAIALSYTEAVVSLSKKDLHKVSNGLVSNYLGKTISVLFLKDLFQQTGTKRIYTEGAFHDAYDELRANEKLDVVIVSYANKYIGLIVDKLLQQKEIVEKTLLNPVDNLSLISGATILGNGNVCLVLDIPGITNILFREKMTQKII
jgi:two-component system, chemotaxis family, sensor kinase CheA